MGSFHKKKCLKSFMVYQLSMKMNIHKCVTKRRLLTGFTKWISDDKKSYKIRHPDDIDCMIQGLCQDILLVNLRKAVF